VSRTASDEDFDDGFLDVIEERFAGFGNNPATAHDRGKRERHANLTAAQRKRRGPPTKPEIFRATERTRNQLRRLAAKLGNTKTDVFAEAIELLARKHGVEGD
jgi:hypothetical protein